MDQIELRKTQLENYLTQLEIQKAELISKKNKLKQLLSKEKKDVEKLNGRSLSVLFISVFGNKHEELSKEEVEAYEAEVKYDCAKREVEEILYDIEKAKKEYDELINFQPEENQIEENQIEEIEKTEIEATEKDENGDSQESIQEQHDSDSKIGFVKNQLLEILQVIEVVIEIQRSTILLESQLVEINSWGFFDMLGVGQVSDKARIEGFDNAQNQAENIQANSRRLWTEIEDVDMDLTVKIQVENLINFSEYFYQGLFQDITQKKNIKIALEEIQKVKEDMENVRIALCAIKSLSEEKLKKLNSETL